MHGEHGEGRSRTGRAQSPSSLHPKVAIEHLVVDPGQALHQRGRLQLALPHVLLHACQVRRRGCLFRFVSRRQPLQFACLRCTHHQALLLHMWHQASCTAFCMRVQPPTPPVVAAEGRALQWMQLHDVHPELDQRAALCAAPT